jgi:hypothetical protein
MGPWESVPATPQRERGRAAGGSKGSGIQRRVEHRSGGAGSPQVFGSSDAMRDEKTLPGPDAPRRRIFASPPTHFCAVMRHAAPRMPSPRPWNPTRPATHANKTASRHAPPARTSPRQPDRSASRQATFARIPAAVIGFVSQFFSSTWGFPQLDEPSRPPFLVRGRRQGWRAAMAASRQSARRNPIPPRSVLHDDSHSPDERVLADRRYGRRAATRTGSGEFSIS